MSATALAATCAMESNCQNVGASGGGSASGAFQMINSTYTADINGAVAYDPAFQEASCRVLLGRWTRRRRLMRRRMSCGRRVIFAGTTRISDPTVLQARAVYQFGGNVGLDVAAAKDSDNIAQITGLSAASLAANGLTTSSTVGQWRQTIINKLGSETANQSVLQQ